MTDPAPNLPNFDPFNEENVRDAFMEKIGEARKRFMELQESHSRAPATVESDEQLGQFTTLVKGMKECAKVIEQARKEEKGRYDACGKVVHGAALHFIDQLKKMAAEGEQRMTVYQRKKADEERRRREEEARKAAEEAERARKEAEAKTEALQSEEDLGAALAAEEEAQRQQEAAEKARREAEANPADMHRSRGEYGGVSSLRSALAFKIEDIHQIPLEALRAYFTPDAIEKAVRAYMKANAEEIKRAVKDGKPEFLRGVRFFEDIKTTVR